MTLTAVGVVLPTYLKWQRTTALEARRIARQADGSEDNTMARKVYERELAFRARVDAEIARRKEAAASNA